jgi:hypothetical protein
MSDQSCLLIQVDGWGDSPNCRLVRRNLLKGSPISSLKELKRFRKQYNTTLITLSFLY